MVRFFLAALVLMSATLSGLARSNDLYNSFVEAIDQANSQAHVTFADGVYLTAAGDSTMVWDLTGGNRATIGFKYANHTLQSGSISFLTPLKVEVRAASGLCSIFTVKKLSFDTGGALDPDNSDFALTPPSQKSCNYSKNSLLLEQHFSLTNDSGAFFHGRIFSSWNGFKKCVDRRCKQTTVGQPLTKVVFFSKALQDGSLDAISVSLRSNATLRLPSSGGWIQVADGTQAKVAQLTYDVIADSGTAFINEISIKVRSGSISTGDNVLNLEDGSQIAFTSVDIEKDKGVTTIKGGDISGALGSQTALVLTSTGNKKSIVLFNKGEVALKDVHMDFSAGKSALRARYGTMKGDIREAQLYFSERNNLNLAGLNFQIELKCLVPSDLCYGIEWQSGGRVMATGVITPFNATVTGGVWAIDTQNSLKIASGTVRAPILKLDTRAAFFPLSGQLSQFELALQAQDVRLATDANVATIGVNIASTDLRLSEDDAYPIGSLTFDGTIKSATFGNLNAVGFVNANLHLAVSRAASDAMRIDDGTIKASAQVKAATGDSGTAAVSLTKIKAYTNEASAKFTLSVDSFQSVILLPGGTTSTSQGNDLAKVEADIDVKAVTLKVSLARPLEFNGFLTVKNGAANIADIHDAPLDVDMALPLQELVYVRVTGRSVGGGVNLCNPKVVLDGGTNRINGKADLGVSNGAVQLSLHNFALQSDIAMHSEDRNCKYVAGLICGAIGSIGGPVTAAAGAAMCGGATAQAEHDASGKINDAVRDAVSGFKYTLGQ